MKKLILFVVILIPILTHSQTTVTIGNDTIPTLYGPIYIENGTTVLEKSSFASIYSKSEILAAGGYAGSITRLSWFKLDTAGYPGGNAGLEIYIKNTLYTESATPIMVDNEVWNANSVYASTTQIIPSTTGWIDFNLDTPFYWNGSDNILILVRWKPNGFGTGTLRWQSSNLDTSKTSFVVYPLYINAISFKQRPNIEILFSTQPTMDAGVVSIDSVRGKCPGTTGAYATIKNFGTNTINSAQVNWELDGILQTPIPFAGNLAPLETANVFLGNVTLTSGIPISLVAWTAAPNGLADTVNFNDTIRLVNLLPGLNGNYTIGLIGADFPSFASAVSSLENNGVCGPTEFLVDTGTYPEKIILRKVQNTSLANTVIFRSSNNDSSTVILTSPTSAIADSNFTIRLEGSEFITFKSMTISRTDTNAYSNVVELSQSASHISFLNNRLIGPTTVYIRDPDGVRCGIYCQGNLVWNDLLVENNYFYGNANGIWMNGSLSHYTDSLRIKNNIIETFYCGSYLLHQNSPVVDGNVVARYDSLAIELYYGLYLRYIMGSPVVVKNKITGHQGTHGIRIINFDTTTSRGLLANNFVQLSPWGPGNGISIEMGSKNLDVIHNSVNITNTFGTTGRAFYAKLNLPGAGNIRVMNNIFNATRFAMALDSGALNGIVISDNNCFHTTDSSSIAAIEGVLVATFSDIQLMTQRDSNSVAIDPNYFSYNNLHTMASGLSNAGSPLTGLSEDIDGDIRSLTNPDIGADEFLDVGTTSTSRDNLIRVFPNPVHGILSIDASQTGNMIEKISVIDILGREVILKLVHSAECRLDVSACSKGFYLLRIEHQGFNTIRRVVIN